MKFLEIFSAVTNFVSNSSNNYSVEVRNIANCQRVCYISGDVLFSDVFDFVKKLPEDVVIYSSIDLVNNKVRFAFYNIYEASTK